MLTNVETSKPTSNDCFLKEKLNAFSCSDCKCNFGLTLKTRLPVTIIRIKVTWSLFENAAVVVVVVTDFVVVFVVVSVVVVVVVVVIGSGVVVNKKMVSCE